MEHLLLPVTPAPVEPGIIEIRLAAAMIGALYCTFDLDLPYADSAFEAVLGWAGTEFSFLLSVPMASWREMALRHHPRRQGAGGAVTPIERS